MSKRYHVKKGPNWTAWLILGLGLLILIFLLQGSGTKTPGTTAGILVYDQDSNQVGGTVFVTTLPNQEGKYLCTIEHIAEKANTYGIAQKSPDFQLVGSFKAYGNQYGPESIMCAPVHTEWAAFKMDSSVPLLDVQGRVFTPQGKYYGISLREYATATGNTGRSGNVLVTSGVTVLYPTTSGSPLTLDTNPNLVIGVLVGGNSQNIFLLHMVSAS